MKVAYFSPLPPEATGIADYSATLLPSLLPHWNITLFVEQTSVRLPDGLDHLPVRPISSFQGPLQERYNMCVYQMGNNVHYHEQIYTTLVRFPGVAVLHDPNLHGFHVDHARRQQSPRSALVREFSLSHGYPGARYARQLFSPEAIVDGNRFSHSARLAQISTGIIVHSQHAQRLILANSPRALVRVVQQPVPLTERRHDKLLAKELVGLPPDSFLLASFGFASPNKHIHNVIEVIPQLRSVFPNLHYAVVGQTIAGYDLDTHIKKLGLQDCVHLTSYVDESLYMQYLLATDIGINIRYPTTGETSAALLRMMASGIPCIVSDVDAFSELPDDAVVKLAPNESPEEQLRQTFEMLIPDQHRQALLSQSALEYISTYADPAKTASDYAAFVDKLLSFKRILD